MRGTTAAREQGLDGAVGKLVPVAETVTGRSFESMTDAGASAASSRTDVQVVLRPTVYRATRGALAAMGLLGVVALAPAAARAQSQLSLAGHGARDFALPGAPYLYGASLATYTSAVGVRIGGALGDVREVHASSAVAGADTRLELGAWTADVDVIVAPAQIRAVRAALGGLGPYAFVGLGTQGVRRTALAPRESGPAWSYGGGLAQPLLGALWFETEARYRMPIVHDGVLPPAGFTRAWEYRLGLALRFGGGDRDGRDGHDAGSRRGRRRGGGGRGEWERARDPR